MKAVVGNLFSLSTVGDAGRLVSDCISMPALCCHFWLPVASLFTFLLFYDSALCLVMAFQASTMYLDRILLNAL
jgi:hypothetical protein